MKNKLFILVVLNLFFCSLSAQESVLSSGGDTIFSAGSISYSIGQVNTGFVSNENNTVY